MSDNYGNLAGALALAWISTENWYTDENGREWLLVDPKPVQEYFERQKARLKDDFDKINNERQSD